MSEYDAIAPSELRAAVSKHHGRSTDDGVADCLLCIKALRAAATIEALQAQLAERAPASADTDEARRLFDRADGLFHDLTAPIRPVTTPKQQRDCLSALHGAVHHGYKVLDALDASRAECERLRGLLREAEWSGYIEGGPISDGGEWYPDCCPWCGGHRIETGHTAGCPCAAALGDSQ